MIYDMEEKNCLMEIFHLQNGRVNQWPALKSHAT